MNNRITEGYMPFMGYQTYYRIVGEPSEKAPLLLLHGGPGSTHNYFEVLDCIADTGRQVISHDQIGCGNLTKAMLRPLIGRNVILSPENGKFNEWSEKGKALAHMFKRLWITDIMEKCNREEGEDIADLILRKYTSWKLDGEDIINLRWGLLPLY